MSEPEVLSEAAQARKNLQLAARQHAEVERRLEEDPAVRENFRRRCQGMSLEELSLWLGNIDTASPGGIVAFEVISEAIEALGGPAAAPVTDAEAETREEIMRLEAQRKVLIELANEGDDRARAKANEIHARLVELRVGGGV